MKRITKHFFCVGLMTSLAVQAQQSAQSGGQESGLPPGLEDREQLPPGLEKREQLPPGLERRSGTQGRVPGQTNLYSGISATNTNSVATATASSSTNVNSAVGGAGGAGLSGSVTNSASSSNLGSTSAATNANRAVGGGSVGTSGSASVSQSSNTSSRATSATRLDRASTAKDRQLLTTIRQQVTQSISSSSQIESLPVHFVVQNGVVTLVGQAPSIEVRQRLVTVINGIPGVTRVVDRIEIANASSVSGNVSGAAPATVLVQDRAYTSADQQLLVTVRRHVLPLLGTSETASPVHFIVRNGAITLVGDIPSVQVKQRVLAAIQQTTGVTQVIDQTTSAGNSSSSGSVGGTSERSTSSSGYGSSASTNNLTGAATNAAAGSLAGTNLTPTGNSSTNRLYQDNQRNNRQGLPPGLEKRDTLPPGLEKRDTLPPGLEKRTENGNDRSDR